MNKEKYPWKQATFKCSLDGSLGDNELMVGGMNLWDLGFVRDSFCIKFDGLLPTIHLEIPLSSCKVEIDGGIKINNVRTHEMVAYEIYKKLQEHFFSQTIPRSQGS